MFNIPKKISYLVKSEIGLLYFTHALRTFGGSMISVFIPIFLLDLGFSVLDVAVFYLFQSLFIIFCVQYFIVYAAKKGAKKSMIVSTPLLLLFFVMLFWSEYLLTLLGFYPYLFLVSLVGIISSAFYWMGLHIDFAKVHTENRSAKQVSWLHALSIFFSVFGPLLGALLISLYSFEITFLFVCFVFSLSLIPLLLTKDIHEPFSINIKNIFSNTNRKKYFPYFGEGFRNMIAAIYWPVLLYLIAISIRDIGGIYTLTNALMAFVTLYIGKITSDKNKHKILNLGAFLHSVSFIARVLLKTVTSIAAAQGLGAISYSMMRTPYESIHYNRSKKEGIAQTVYAREFYLHSGKTFGFFVLLTGFLIFREYTSALISAIIFAVFATFLMSRIKD